ncbi:hypothetical protein E4U13_006823 [Claviceps humidiphila]|uniref:HTH CENPB-type domain-containing protein n=1 Tax=Claviceps humidiphila TaxID=1294629 RepID=A0A9P7TZZ6_9HYPO|nr:hypothetical protein E4U13_006823 [Claviceps humidiphila]
MASSRPGPKITPLATRGYVPPDPITSVKRRYPRRRKIEVLLFLLHHRIHDDEAPESEHYVELGLRRPYIREAAAWFNINRRTINGWWNKRDSFVEIQQNTFRPHWPESEKRIRTEFIARGGRGHPVRTGWFRSRRAYPGVVDEFGFTEGWFNSFKRRRDIVHRRITKQASKSQLNTGQFQHEQSSSGT